MGNCVHLFRMYMKRVANDIRVEFCVFLILCFYRLLYKSIVLKRSKKLPFICAMARLEQIFGITFYASEFRTLFHYRTLVYITKEKVNEKDC